MFNRKTPNDTHDQSPHAESSSPGGGGEGAGEDHPHEASAGDVSVLHSEIAQLALERDEARSNLMRALADYQNYQRRSLQNEHEAKRQGAINVVMSVVPVLDHFDMALAQPTPDEATSKIVSGVRVIREELLKALERQGVSMVNPRPNDEFDPTRHQAVVQTPIAGVEPGRISLVLQVGYALDGRVIRSAMVGVAPKE